MATYDTIAEDYARCKLAPWRRFIERPTLFGLLGEPGRLSVLDLACGSGFYSRLIRSAGAAHVVGVDLSSAMIDLAQREEAAKPLGIEYRVGDAAGLELGEALDVVFAAYLFNYSRSAGELRAMARAVTRHLKPGGRLVAAIDSPEHSPAAYERTRKYGSTKSAAMPLQEGTPIHYTMFPEGGRPFTFDNYFLSLPTYHRAFHAAGLRDLSWHLPRLSAEGEAETGSAFWDDFLADPPVMFLTARKAVS
jgi:SAM-dependent methyltransferase